MMDGCPSEVGSYQATMSRAYQDIKEDVVMTDLSAAEATSARDALCKALYCRLFTWIVSSTNERMRVRRLFIYFHLSLGKRAEFDRFNSNAVL